MPDAKRIVILGSTGSIGEQTLQVVREFPERFRVVALAAGRRLEKLAAQVRELRPELVSVAEAADAAQLREMVATTRREGFAYNNLHLFEGMENVTDMAAVSVPIRRRDGTPVAALHLTAIPSRLEPPRRDSIVSTLKNEAAEMEEKMEPVLQSIGNPSRAMGKGRTA